MNIAFFGLVRIVTTEAKRLSPPQQQLASFHQLWEHRFNHLADFLNPPPTITTDPVIEPV